MPTNSTVRNYEAMVILNPGLGDEDTKALVDRLGGILAGGGASLKETALWGKRRLAYEIERKAEGYFVIYYFTLSGGEEVLGAFERACRYDEQVMRHMVVKVPTKKRGQEVAQLVPAPGYLADFKLEPRSTYRRRPDYDRGAPAQAPAGAANTVPDTAPPAAPEAPAEEPAKE